MLRNLVLLHHEVTKDVRAENTILLQPEALLSLGVFAVEYCARASIVVGLGYETVCHFQEQVEPLSLQDFKYAEIFKVMRSQIHYILLLFEDALELKQPVIIQEHEEVRVRGTLLSIEELYSHSYELAVVCDDLQIHWDNKIRLWDVRVEFIGLTDENRFSHRIA